MPIAPRTPARVMRSIRPASGSCDATSRRAGASQRGPEVRVEIREAGIWEFSLWHHDNVQPWRHRGPAEDLANATLGPVALDGAAVLPGYGDTEPARDARRRHDEDDDVSAVALDPLVVGPDELRSFADPASGAEAFVHEWPSGRAGTRRRPATIRRTPSAACAPWHGAASAPGGRSWCSSGRGSRASGCGDGGLAGTYASWHDPSTRRVTRWSEPLILCSAFRHCQSPVSGQVRSMSGRGARPTSRRPSPDGGLVRMAPCPTLSVIDTTSGSLRPLPRGRLPPPRVVPPTSAVMHCRSSLPVLLSLSRLTRGEYRSPRISTDVENSVDNPPVFASSRPAHQGIRGYRGGRKLETNENLAISS